jgi:hypothetical protein
VKSGSASISGNIVTPTAIGSVVIAANQLGDFNYAGAPEVTTSFNVVPGNQSISFAPVADQVTGVPFTITLPTASSGLPVSIAVSGPATLSGNTITPTGVGTVTLFATQSGDANYNAAPQVSVSFKVKKYGQIIAGFPSIPTKVYGAAAFAATPKASSGLPVTLSVISGPATIKGGKVAITGTGVVVLAANQVGNASYAAATQITTSFTVNPANQTIAKFAAIPTKTHGTPAFKVAVPKASSGLPVTLSVQSGPATISGNMVSVTGVGTVVLAADQQGSANYNVAPTQTVSFTVR